MWWLEKQDIYDWYNDGFYLIMYCYKYFKIWYNPEKIFWEKHKKFLEVYCNKYKNIWKYDYVKYQLSPKKPRIIATQGGGAFKLNMEKRFVWKDRVVLNHSRAGKKTADKLTRDRA